MSFLSIIIPTYNEAENIPLLIRSLEQVFSGNPHEIIIVDDNSPDGTAAAVASLPSFGKTLRLVRRKAKLGLASAVVDGAMVSKGDALVVMDADLSHPPEKAAELFSALSDCDLVIGSRNIPKGGVENWTPYRKAVSLGADFMARVFLGIDTTDPMSGFFAIRKSIFMKTRFRVRGYKILLNILSDNPKMKIREIPYFFRHRHAGVTKLVPREFLEYLFDLFRLRFRSRA